MHVTFHRKEKTEVKSLTRRKGRDAHVSRGMSENEQILRGGEVDRCTVEKHPTSFWVDLNALNLFLQINQNFRSGADWSRFFGLFIVRHFVPKNSRWVIGRKTGKVLSSKLSFWSLEAKFKNPNVSVKKLKFDFVLSFWNEIILPRRLENLFSMNFSKSRDFWVSFHVDQKRNSELRPPRSRLKGCWKLFKVFWWRSRSRSDLTSLLTEMFKNGT